MKKLVCATLLAAVLVLTILAIAGAASQEKAFESTFAGSWTNKDDLSYTGVATDGSGIGFFQGKSSLGNFIGQGVATSGKTGKECTDANGAKGTEYAMRGSAYIFTFEDAGDQLFLGMSATKGGIACGVSGVGTSGATNLEVKGGTGRFEGATGSLVKTYKLAPVAPPVAPGKGRLSTFTGSFNGTVVLANGKAWPF